MTTSPSAKIVVIGGPTASGKSALALTLAERLNGEIICADSRQIYAGLEIASAAPSESERKRAPHHGYGAVDPAADKMNAGRFTSLADQLVDDVRSRGHVPILVGGTGLYLRAWRVGLDEPALTAEPAERNMAALMLRPARREAHWLLVDAPLDVLEPRIRARTAEMFERAPLLPEARALAARLPSTHPILQTIGIKEALLVEHGSLTVDDAIAQTTLRTRQYARRQRTWFKKEPWWTRLDATRDDVVAAAVSRVSG